MTVRTSHGVMRLTEAHVAPLPSSIDAPGAVLLDRDPWPDSYYSETTAALIDAVPPDVEMWLYAYGLLIWTSASPQTTNVVAILP